MDQEVTGARTILSMGEPMVEFAAASKGPLAGAEQFVRGWGGDTSNFAVAVARLGGNSAYMCRLGDDPFGQSLMAMWAREGVDTSRVTTVAGHYTAVYFISYTEDGQHDFTYLRAGSAASTLTPDDIRPKVFREVAAFHTSGITQAISTTSCDATFAAMETARRLGVLVSYDPNVRPKLWSFQRARAVVMESASMADIVLPSEDDARMLTGLDDPTAMADRFLERGARMVALKRGEKGCLIVTAQGERVEVPALAVETVDTGGAGDTFDAALVLALVEGRGLEAAGRIATTAAALVTTGVGCVSPIPYKSTVEQYLRTRG